MFATVGSGGTVQSPSTLIDAGGHSAMQHKNYTLGGSMYMELEKNRLTAKFYQCKQKILPVVMLNTVVNDSP